MPIYQINFENNYENTVIISVNRRWYLTVKLIFFYKKNK
jgi:hypothetical protein